MKYIISGTNRPNSRTLVVAQLVQQLYRDQGESVEIIDLSKISLNALDGTQYGDKGILPPPIADAIHKINTAEGVIVICPEYNGSYPGALKLFIDHWKYPDTFEHRPICMVGLGGTFGGLRPVEHLQQVFNYRNAYVFPNRVFLTNIWHNLKDGKMTDPNLMGLLRLQADRFSVYVRALQNEKMDANSILAVKKP
jgi:chromate reductase, NAD(P)H dehydrogenase (quinone)